MKQVKSILIIILGNMLYALSVQLFLVHSGLLTGGTTGIALAVNAISGFSISLFVLIFNIIMLILGWLVLGKKFALTTILSTFVYPLSLSLFEQTLKNTVLTTTPILNAIFAGLGIGLSLGLVIREGASTGGMDIPPIILNKLFNLPVSATMYAFDFAILIFQAFLHTPEEVLYGILIVLIYTLTLDKLLLSGTAKTEVKVISKKTDEIRQAILQEMDRGVTMLDAKGGYGQEQQELLLSIISNRELPAIEKIIRRMDPAAFVIVSRVSQVEGRGFTMKKKYPDHHAR